MEEILKSSDKKATEEFLVELGSGHSLNDVKEAVRAFDIEGKGPGTFFENVRKTSGNKGGLKCSGCDLDFEFSKKQTRTKGEERKIFQADCGESLWKIYRYAYIHHPQPIYSVHSNFYFFTEMFKYMMTIPTIFDLLFNIVK